MSDKYDVGGMTQEEEELVMTLDVKGAMSMAELMLFCVVVSVPVVRGTLVEEQRWREALEIQTQEW